MDSLQGHFLVASPHLPDPNFARTVVLLIEHHAQGAMGLVLNRPSATSLRTLWQQVEDSPCQSEQCVCVGGPVQGPVVALHGHREFSEVEVLPGVHVATQRHNIRGLVQFNEPPFRIFTGYAGWGAGQLEEELNLGGWLTIEATVDMVFTNDLAGLWQFALNLSGREFLRDTLGIDNFPDDPSVN
jgi:putative transcriptional regulator